MSFMPQAPAIGWRAKIGVLIPEHGYLDEDLWGFAAPGVTLLMARTRVQADDSIPSIVKLAEDRDTDRTAQGFSRVNVNALTYACTAVGFVRGPHGDEDLNERMSRASKAPATCTITASVAALRSLRISKIAVATPYVAELNELLCKFFEHHKINVVKLHNIDLVGKFDGAEVNSVPLEVVAKLAKDADSPDAEAVYIACTGLRTVPILGALEEDLEKPVISANQATMWHAQQLAGVKPRLNGLGTLFDTKESHALRNSEGARSGERSIALVGKNR